MRTTIDRIRDVLVGAWAVAAIVYLFIPIFVIVLFSFNDNKGRFNFSLAIDTDRGARAAYPERIVRDGIAEALRRPPRRHSDGSTLKCVFSRPCQATASLRGSCHRPTGRKKLGSPGAPRRRETAAPIEANSRVPVRPRRRPFPMPRILK